MQCERAAAVRTIHSNGNLVSSEKCYQNSMKTDFKIDVKISETLYSLDKGCKCPRVSSRLLQTPPTSLSDTKGDGLSPLVQKPKYSFLQCTNNPIHPSPRRTRSCCLTTKKIRLTNGLQIPLMLLWMNQVWIQKKKLLRVNTIPRQGCPQQSSSERRHKVEIDILWYIIQSNYDSNSVFIF